MAHRAEDILGKLWAKSGNPPHGLLAHMLDTAAVALEVLDREPVSTRRSLARALELPENVACRFAAFIAAVHDLGKATPVFQKLWQPGAHALSKAGLPFPAGTQGLTTPHGALTEHLLRLWLLEKGLARGLARDVARAAAAHHGFPPDPSHVTEGLVASGTGPWDRARHALLEALLAALDPRPWPAVPALDPAATILLMGLTSVSDWIASAKELFPYGREVHEPREFLEESRVRARQALDHIGWNRRRPLADHFPEFAKVFPGCHPNPMQERVIATAARARLPVLIVIEAPMGAGKTEAALYTHLLLQQRLQHRGLYVALPTMATGNAMFPRVREFLIRSAERVVDLHLQHGLATVNEDYRALQLEGVGEDITGDDSGGQGVVAAEWFTARKRAMLSEYGVGTVDQALLGVLRVRHHFVRLFGLGNRTVVLDEVHAYDTYTSGLIEALLRWLKAQGSSVILMSATLPSNRREELLKAYGADGPVPDVPYPRVTVVEGGRVHAEPIPWECRQTVRLQAAPQDVGTLAALARSSAEQGGCVLCVVNTVDRAQCLYKALGEGQPARFEGTVVGKRCGDLEVYLVHARFPGDERDARERWLLTRFGRQGYHDGTRPSKAVVIATQVVEQSLDVDFDLLITDLAPVDLILQRIGRLHRFPNLCRPPAFAEPRCVVAGGPPDLPEMGEWAHVYSGYVLLRTWCVLRERNAIVIPEDLQVLVDRVYAQEEAAPPGLADVLRRWREEHEREQERLVAWVRANALQDGRELLEWSPGLLAALRLEDDEEAESQVPLTRMGEPSVTVVPCHRIGKGLSLDPEGRDRVDLEQLPDDAQARRILLRAVRLGGRLVYGALRERPVPPGWRKHPLLRRLRVLELVDGVANLGVVRIESNPELGIVYHYQH